MKDSTDRLIRRATILAMLAIVAFTCYRVLNIREAAGKPAPVYTVGETLGLAKNMLPDAKHTVLIFGRSTCGACQAAKPTMKALIEAVNARNDGTHVRFMAVVGREESELKMADDIGVRRDDVVDFRRQVGISKLRSVPTFMVVDANQRIGFVSEGASSDMNALLAALDK